MSEILYKSNGTLKDVDTKQGIITGYLSSFNTLDLHGDIVKKGAFAKTIAERGPAGSNEIEYLQDHNPKMQVGWFIQLKEDDFGLYYEGQTSKKAEGQDFLKMVEQKIIRQHSFGYRIINSTKTTEANLLTELKLFEGSGLRRKAANPNTPVLEVKSANGLIEHFENLQKALKSGTFTDECFQNVIIPEFNATKELIDSYAITKPSVTDTLPKMEDVKLIIQQAFKHN